MENQTTPLEQVDPTIESDVTVAGSSVDTQTSTPTASPTDAGGHEEQSSASESTSAQSDVDEKKKLAEKREESKLQKVQEELKQEKARLRVIEERYFLKNEKRYRNALIETSDKTPEEADQIINQLKQENPGLWAKQDSTQSKPQVSTEESKVTEIISKLPEFQLVKQQAQEIERQKTEANKKEEAWFTKFEEERPDIAEIENPGLVRSQIGSTANFYMQTKGLDKEKAYDMAYTTILHPERLAEKGKLDGYLAAVNKQSASSTPVTGEKASGSGIDVSGLTDFEREVARQTNMKPEEYAKWKNEN